MRPTSKKKATERGNASLPLSYFIPQTVAGINHATSVRGLRKPNAFLFIVVLELTLSPHLWYKYYGVYSYK